MTVRYTPGQLRGALEIPPETYRHWKKTLAPLRRQRGHSPCFTAGDLVAVAVVHRLSIELGIRVSMLTSISEPLFQLCNGAPWPVLERGYLIVDLSGRRIEYTPEFAERSIESVSIAIRLRPIVTQLRGKLLEAANIDDQQALQFPLAAVSSSAVSSGRSRP
jgi:hypothetical protein